MKKLFHLFQWALLIAFCLLGLRLLLRPVAPPRYQPDTWTSWNGFYALSYAGISRDDHPDYVAPRRLAEQLEALSQAGYQTIFPEDARAYLEGRHPLPEKALLLLFEGGRKDSLVNATPILRRLGLVATMFVPTALTERWGSFYLRRSDLKKMVTYPHWHLASMGHRAVEAIPIAGGGEGHYLTQRRPAKDGLESDADFRARIAADFVEATRRLARAGFTNQTAYLFPFGDAGTSAEADPLAADTIREVLSLYHNLAFTRSDDAYNGPTSEPYQLTRLRVPGSWDAATLLRELEKAEPQLAPVLGVGGPENWTFEGAAEAVDQELRLAPGARAWLRGSGVWTDGDLACTFKRNAGALVLLYLRYAGPNSYLRLSIDDQGLRLQERLGRTTQTLALIPAAASTNGESHQLSLRLRGPRLWLSDHGQSLAGPLPLTRATARGRIGFEVTGAHLDLTAFSAHPRLGTVALAEQFRPLSAEQQDRISLFLAPWFEAGRPPAVSDDQRADLLAAAAQGVAFVPVIAGTSGLNAEQAAAYVEALVAALEPVITQTLVTRLAVYGGGDPVAHALRERGFGVVRLLDGVTALAHDTYATLGRDTLVLVNPGRDGQADVQRLLDLAPVHRLAAVAPDGVTLPAGMRSLERY